MTGQSGSSLKGRIPAALRNYFPSDGIYKVLACDFGTGNTCINHGNIQVDNPNQRPELTTEVPTVCAHIPGETDESKAQHGYEVDPVGDETGAVVIDRIKEALYSGPEAEDKKEALRNFALKIPYLTTRYGDTALAANPEIWMLADYILWLAQLVTSNIVKDDLNGDPIWVFTVPSNWNKGSITLYTSALDASPVLIGRYLLQSEIESSIAGLIHQSPEQSGMMDGDVFFTFDVGKGTSDFSICRQMSSDPTQVEEIMPPAALFAGSRTVLQLWESHIRNQCKKESNDLDYFESELAILKESFVRSMHAYIGQSGKEVDRAYRICGQKITVTRDQMKSWFDEWMHLTTTFLAEQCEKYHARPDCSPPSKFFLMGGSSNSIVLQTCIKDFLKNPFFRNTKLILLGDCNSATIVAYGAVIRAVTSVMSIRKSHYWIGLARKEYYDKKKHANLPQADLVNDYIMNENGKMKKEKQVKTIQWWAQPGENCIVNGSIDQMPFIKMSEFFDEEGSVANQATDYKVPIMVFICPSMNSSQVMNNDEDDIANSGAGKRGWSYQSARPKTEEINFEIDFSPSIPNPLLIASELVPVNGFYNVNWTIFAETTGIGIDFWCAVRSNDQDLNNSNDIQTNMRMVYRVLHTDLVGVIQQSYAVDDDETVEQNDEDNEVLSIGMKEKGKEKETGNDNDERKVEQLNSENEELLPSLVAPRPTSKPIALHNTKAASMSNSNKRQGPEQLEEQPEKKKAKSSTLSSQHTNARNEPLIQPQVAKRLVRDTLAPTILVPEVQSPSSKSLQKQLEKSPSEMFEDGEEESVLINPETMLKNISDLNETTGKPDREDFEDEDEYNAAMSEYIDQLQRDELTRLQAGCDSEACMHFNEQIWIQVCQFIHHKPTLKKPVYCVKVPGGFGHRLLPCQLHGVWYSLRQIHGIAGSIFLCHIMGIGKTTMALAVHWIQHIFNMMWADISANSKAHTAHGECPANKQMYKTYGFDCPCSPDSPNHWLKERLGVTVALVPLGLLNVWKAEHTECFKGISDQILVKAHGTSNASGGDQLNDRTQDLLEGEEIIQEEVYQSDGDESLQESEKPKTPSIYTPRLQNGHVFVITTPDSFASQFLNKFQHTKTWWYQPPGKEARQRRETPAYQSCIVSLLFKDEFQLRRTESIRAIQDIQRRQYINNEATLLRDCRHEVYHRIALVLLSGTPLTTGPLDISGFVQLMCRDRWREDAILQNWMHNELQDLGEKWKKWTDSRSINTQDVSHEITQKFSPLVENLMIRWTTNSDLLGEKPVIVPRNLYSNIKCNNGSYWTSRVDSLGQEESKRLERRENIRRARYQARHGHLKGYESLDKTNVNIYYRFRLCASFPKLMDLTDDEGIPLKLTEGEWVVKSTGKDPEWKQETDTDPYFNNLKEIVASSGKLRGIEKKINKYKYFRDAEKKLARQVFCSYFFAGAYIMYLWMVHILEIEPADIIFLYKPMGQAKINAALARFYIDVDSKVPAEDQRTARYIVSTSSSFAVGLTLASAISVAFLEPDYHADTVAQGFHRHCRQGNKNLDHGVESWMFMVKDNKVEARIFDVNNLRKQIISAAERKVDVAKKVQQKDLKSSTSKNGINSTASTAVQTHVGMQISRTSVVIS
ncbi:hypothetical protein H4I95_12038 [Botrytis cinerea]